MKRLRFFLLLIIFFIIGSYSLFCHIGFLNVNKQLNSIVTEKNITNIEKISTNTETANFQKNLSKDTRCKRTSNFQGVNSKDEQYFVTTLNERRIQLFIKEDTQSSLYLIFFPDWSITSVEAM